MLIFNQALCKGLEDTMYPPHFNQPSRNLFISYKNNKKLIVLILLSEQDNSLCFTEVEIKFQALK